RADSGGRFKFEARVDRGPGAGAAPLPATPPRCLSRGGAAARGRCFLATVAPAGLLLLGGLLGLRSLALDELHDREVCGVAQTVAELHHARVAAVALGVARRDVVEQLLHDARPPQHARRPSPRVQGALLAEGDHPVGPATDLLRFGVRGANRLVLEE